MSDNIEFTESPLLDIVRDLAKNTHLTPEAQNAIARFISVETTPLIRIKGDLPETLFESKLRKGNSSDVQSE